MFTYEDGQAYLESILSNIVTVPGDDLDGDGVLPAEDLDDDNDGLIEIHYLEELDAIRHQLDGSGYRAGADAELITSGCPISGCIGYELMRDLDFTTTQSYSAGAKNRDWMVDDFSDANDASWQPIGGVFDAIFNGNGYTISNLQINRSVGDKGNVALFAEVGSRGRIESLGLEDVAIKALQGSGSGNKNVGGIAGVLMRGAVIVNSYVISSDAAVYDIRGDKGGFIGGMVGLNRGYILNSYANINVQDSDASVAKDTVAGGLVGRNLDGGKIHNSYASGDVKGACFAGGLAGDQFSSRSDTLENTSEIRNSYAGGSASTRFGICATAAKRIAGGVVAVNDNAIIANSYANGKAYVRDGGAEDCTVATAGDRGGLAARLLPSGDDSIANPLQSYWNRAQYDSNCISENRFYDGDSRSQNILQSPTMPNVSRNDCSGYEAGSISTVVIGSLPCTTYENWSMNNWHFGTSTEFPSVKYAIGLDQENPGCGFGVAGLPQCGDLLSEQPSAVPVLPLAPPSLRTLPQLRVRYALNRSARAAFNARDIVDLNEGDTLSLDAANSFTEDDIVLAYLWRQMSGPALLPQSVSAAAFTLKVREDLLPADAVSEEAILRLELRERGKPDVLAIMDIRVRIGKTNSGGEITINRGGERLFFVSEINDADGTSFTDISYQWQQQNSDGIFVDIDDANQATYKGAASDQRPLLVTTYGDGQGYFNTVIAIAPLPSTDVDQDGNGLIEIASIEQLNAIRYQLDGSGYKSTATATLNSGGCPEDGCRGYELVRDLDFDDPDSYSTSTDVLIRNWDSIDNFTAIFDGNSFTISNLRIAAESSAAGVNNSANRGLGLFGVVSGNAEIRRVRLANVSIVGSDNVGALVGDFSGNRITDSHVISGNIRTYFDGGCLVGRSSGEITDSSANCQIEGHGRVGGLAGTASNRIDNSFAGGSMTVPSAADLGGREIAFGGLVGSLTGGSIENSYANVAEIDLGELSNSAIHAAGGLLGASTGTTLIKNSYASVNVTSSAIDDDAKVGGLVGISYSQISGSYASGNVRSTMGSGSGGLVGISYSQISDSHASGNVRSTMGSGSGGLVGISHASISDSYASGNVSGIGRVGGLAGDVRSTADITTSFALGNVSGSASQVGGLVGFFGGGRISDSYASGNVSGTDNVGGLVGILNAEIIDSYAIGSTTGTDAKGLVGMAQASASVQRSYWSTDGSGTSDGGVAGAIGFSSELLKSATTPGTDASHPYFNWSDDNWDFGTSEQYPAIQYDDATCDTAMPSENCGKLLPRQRPGLLDIRVSQTSVPEQPRLSPEFSTMVKEYTAHINSNALVKITATAANSDSLISIDDRAVSVALVEYSLPPDFSTATELILRVAEPAALAGEAIEYRLSFNRFPTVDSIERQVAVDEQSDPLAAEELIREGYFITLTGELSDADGDDFSYQWMVDETQLSVVDRSRLTGSVVGSAVSASLSFYLLEDFIASDQSEETVRVSLMLRAADEVAVVVREIAFVVRKRNNGTIGAIGTPTRVGLTYIAPAIDAAKLAEDPDGAGDIGSIRYQWQQQNQGIWSDIAGATARSYSISSVILEYYRVIVGYTDGQAYENEIASAAEPASLDLIINAIPAAGREGFDLLILDAIDLSPAFSRETTMYRVPPETNQKSGSEQQQLAVR